MLTNSELCVKPKKQSILLNASCSSNWEIPPFPNGDVDCDENKMPDVKQFASRGCQVEDEDWVNLEMKQINGELIDLMPNNCECNNEDPVLFEQLNNMSPSHDQRIDRGTSTEDIPGDINYHEKIIKLKLRFPRADYAHIEEVLNACHGDIQWALNLLDQFQDEHFDPEILHLKNYRKSNSSSPKNTSKKDTSNTLVNGFSENFYSIYLDHASAIALQETFGQILKPQDIDEAYLRIQISPSVAKLLHTLWKKTYETTSKKASVYNQRSNLSPGKSQSKTSKVVSPQENYRPKSDLEEIMELEKALELSRKEFNKQGNKNQADKNLIATRMKLDELRAIFPGLNEELLNDIFQAHNCNLDQTIEVINSQYGIAQSLPPEETLNFDEDDYNDIVQPGERVSTEQDDLETLRWKMYECKQKRMELIDKARRSYQAKQFAVASYYTKQSRDLLKELSKLKEKVIDCVLSANPFNTLDLHGVRAIEVIATISSYLLFKKQELDNRKGDRLVLHLITGRGVHSDFGPKLKPMVINYLKQNNYKYSVPNPGMIRVTIT